LTTRRSFLTALGAGYAMANRTWAQSQRGARETATRNSQLFFTTDTAYGKVPGIVNTGIKEFKGIPYGAPTGGQNRYMPPKKLASWTGVRECLGYGPISPQTVSPLTSDYSQLIEWDRHTASGMGEDVLTLNVWTPGLSDSGKRAVLVSFHGGGFATGSGNGPQYDGGQLSRLADVVVVTVNHRLASFGYLHLADLGAPPEFAHAGVVGMMDLVASLEWVRDNIEHFGGDPSKVMIFGQSGGGRRLRQCSPFLRPKGCSIAPAFRADRPFDRQRASKARNRLSCC
jgi:para-nitrobenzyl esterase